MQLALQAALLFTEPLWQRWEQLTAKSREAQKTLLLHLIRRNQSTAFGRDHGFNSIESLADYRKRVPISDYERFRPYIDRVKSGASASLTQEATSMFTLTSGTTGEPKLIPITPSTQERHGKLTRLWYYRASIDHRRCFSGKLLGIVSPAIEGRTSGGIPFGSASGLIFQSSPRWIKNAYLAASEVSEIKDFEAKYYVIMRLAVERNITFIGTPNPSTILRLVETADRRKEEILRDINDGAISSNVALPPDIRARLSKQLGKNMARAKELESFVTRHGRLRPMEYWPGLRLVGCWKGGTVGVRLKEFTRWFAEQTPVRDLGYMASEAQMSLPISDAGSAGILAIDANFYEFIPEPEIGSPNPTTLACDELEEGGVYYLILTTPGGLYRYDINDVIRVTGFYNQTPLIEFVRKGRDVTNLTGEKLHVNQLIQAVEEAQRATGLVVRHYRAFADVEKSRYAFLVEFDGATLPKKALSGLLNELDSRLHQLNVEYAQKRESLRLGAPVLWVMKPGWFERKASSTLQLATGDVQFKSQLLSAAPEDSSEALLIVEKTDAPATSVEPM